MTAESEIPGLTKGRVEALSDGIFATVMTVLVLGLTVPVFIDSDLSKLNADVTGGLGLLAPNILSYVLSYLILTTMWISHHNIFHYVDRLNRPLTWLNALFLLTIAFIPFSTTLMGRYPEVQVTVIIYGLNIVGVALSMQAFLYYARRSGLLVAEGQHGMFIKRIETRWRVGILVYSTAVFVSFLSPEVSVGIYVAASAMFVLSSSLTIKLPRIPKVG